MFSFFRFFLLIILLALSGCFIERTKWNDKNMRIMVEPEGITSEQYTRVIDALVQSGKWTVVDRGPGFTAVRKEQERTLKNNPARFEDREKWAQWGKLWGVGAVAVGQSDCYLRPSSWNFLFRSKYYVECEQFLSLLDANSAEVVASARALAKGKNVEELTLQSVLKPAQKERSEGIFNALRLSPQGESQVALSKIHVPEPEWTEVVQNLEDIYPSNFPSSDYHPRIEQYQDQSGAEARKIMDDDKYRDTSP